MICGCDMISIALGAASSALMPTWRKRLFYFIPACCFFLVVMCALQLRVKNGAVQDRPEEIRVLYATMVDLTSAVWPMYPIIVVAGREQMGLISEPLEEILLTIVDVTAKIGIEMVLIAMCDDSTACHPVDH